MNDEKGNGAKFDKLKTGRIERSWSLAKVGLSAGAKAAGFALSGVFSGKEERDAKFKGLLLQQAELLAGELTKLKGTVMKAGQMLSVLGEHFLPPEVTKVLSQLRAQSKPIEWQVMEKVLKRSLSAEALSELDVNPESYAAASVGQVHRARIIADQTDLCLKIQYPGVDKAIDSDIATIRSLLSFARLLPKNLDFEPIFKEVRYMLKRELDYQKELENTVSFAELLADDPRYVVPKVFPRYSGKRTLATSFEEGVELTKDLRGSMAQERRDFIGEALLELFFNEFFVWGQVQTDPHFGNYKIRLRPTAAHDQLILLDFGAVRKFSKTFVEAYRDFLRGTLYQDQELFLQATVVLGLLSESEKERSIEKFYELCRLIMEPYIVHGEEGCNPDFMSADGRYDWGKSDLGMRVARKAAEIFYIFKLRTPNREIVFFDRKVSGLFVALNVLAPILPARRLIDRYLISDQT